jgi:hypothetical protein
MVDSRTVTAMAGLVVGLTVSGLAWVVVDTLLVLLFLTFVPFLFCAVAGGRPSGPNRQRGSVPSVSSPHGIRTTSTAPGTFVD